MRSIHLIIALFIFPSFLSAQRVVNWLGGAPGNETNWNDARNWSNYKVPTEDDIVLIRLQNNGHFAQPIINTEVIVGGIEIHPGASLTIHPTGQLTIETLPHIVNGVVSYGGDFICQGDIFIRDAEGQYSRTVPKENNLD